MQSIQECYVWLPQSDGAHNPHLPQRIALSNRLKPLEGANGFDFIGTNRNAALEIFYLAYR